ncbi:hypothetical protein K1X84_03860 [bacterium]|nr:hypothetical protein [bacterium]
MTVLQHNEQLPFEEALESTWHVRFLRLLVDETWTRRVSTVGLGQSANIYSAICYEFPELTERTFIIRSVFNDLYTRGLVNKKFDLIAACSISSDFFKELSLTPLGKDFIKYIDRENGMH